MTATPTRAAGVDTGRALRRGRGILLWVALLVLGGVLVALAAGREPSTEYLAPDGVGQGGAGALVEVLRDQGIDVAVVGTADDAIEAAGSGEGTTVVVGNSDLLSSTAASRVLARTTAADRVVFLDGAPRVLRRLGLGLDITVAAGPVGAADCGVPWVRSDDRVDTTGYMVVGAEAAAELPSGAQGCYPVSPPPGAEGDGDAAAPESPLGWAAVDLPAGPRHAPVTVVGFPDAATNRFVTDADHAGLVVRLLGGSPRLVWYQPTDADLVDNPAPDDERSVWPDWIGPGLALLGLAFVVFAIARGRRLGRLVPEPLPVVVRATETTESRAELYRAAGDRDRAAAVLRRATSARLAARLGLAPGSPHEAVVAAVADASGVHVSKVDALLRPGSPLDEAALVRLAQQLAHLEEKVRSS